MATAAMRDAITTRRSWYRLLFLAVTVFILSRRIGALSVLSAQGSLQMSDLEEKINTSKVLLISKEWCPFCQRAKAVLSNLGVSFSVLELENKARQPLVEDPTAVMDYMENITGARSVPRLFIAGHFIGGCDDVVRMASSGELQKRLKQAGAF
ncbi:unnamed protein product [Effrenium voratum]|uniref:Glutaredoxin domain-containing protein n=1 Tax=Effrenium voratum TaxID=2562239 RepID=A0AA36JA04_9DINO|nr:unnamed protein product [Effrenium voratum]CAJ1423744.1 unnamed protein product [Effrenium voratum]